MSYYYDCNYVKNIARQFLSLSLGVRFVIASYVLLYSHDLIFFILVSYLENRNNVLFLLFSCYVSGPFAVKYTTPRMTRSRRKPSLKIFSPQTLLVRNEEPFHVAFDFNKIMFSLNSAWVLIICSSH